MKDFLEAYRKSTHKKNVAIVASAFAFAVSVNAFLLGTDAGTRIQTSAIEFAGGGKASEIRPDLSLESSGSGSDLLKMVLSRPAKGVKEVRATLVSNAEALKINDVFTAQKDAEIVKISNVDGMMLVNVRFASPQDLSSGAEIAMLAYSKTNPERTQISLVETSFVSEAGEYELTNSAIEL